MKECDLSAPGLTIIAACPAAGKSALMVSMALDMSMHETPVAIFSLELSNMQIALRMLSNVCNMSWDNLRKEVFTDIELAQIERGKEKLRGLPLFIDDTPGLSVAELSAKARLLVNEEGVKMIAIDYLQLMSDRCSPKTKDQDLGMITHSLKELAMELGISVIALLQLKCKRGEQIDNIGFPQLSDFPEINQIERDADVICFIDRPLLHKSGWELKDYEDIKNKAKLIFMKHPLGTRTVEMRFCHEYCRFETLSKNAPRSPRRQ